MPKMHGASGLVTIGWGFLLIFSQVYISFH